MWSPGAGKPLEPNLTIVMYHYVRPIADSAWPRIRGRELSEFQGQLDYIAQHYAAVTVDAVLEASRGGKPLPPNAMLLTFDDGYADHYWHVFPELRKRGLSGVFFPPACAVMERRMLDVNKIHFILAATDDPGALVAYVEDQVLQARQEFDTEPLPDYRRQYAHPGRFDTAEIIYLKRMLQLALPPALRARIVSGLFSRYVTADEKAFAQELYCSQEQLREMAVGGMSMGGHGHAHVWLDSLSPEAQAEDMDRSMAMLDGIGALHSYFLFCYPYGAYNTDTLTLLQERKCAAAFTTRVGVATISAGVTSMLELPRLDTNDLPLAAQGRKAALR